MNNTKVVDNFYIFLESIDAPSYDQWFRSYDQCMLGGVAGNPFWTDQAIWTIWTSMPHPKGNLGEL
jgi:hypothetical protein